MGGFDSDEGYREGTLLWNDIYVEVLTVRCELAVCSATGKWNVQHVMRLLPKELIETLP
jgi:hypothetical protein